MIARCEVILPIPEDQLASRCRSGDMEAFECLYAQFRGPIYRHAYFLLGNIEDARDIRQETFLKAYQSFATFRGDCQLKTWLFTICTNLCRDRLRTIRRRPETRYDSETEMMRLLDEATEDPVAIVELTHTAALIRSVLEGLPETHREIVTLRDLDRLTYNEIARILGCSRASVSVRLYRARTLLKNRVKSLLSEGD